MWRKSLDAEFYIWTGTGKGCPGQLSATCLCLYHCSQQEQESHTGCCWERGWQTPLFFWCGEKELNKWRCAGDLQFRDLLSVFFFFFFFFACFVLFYFLLVSSEGIWMVDSPQPAGLGKKEGFSFSGLNKITAQARVFQPAWTPS